jgi:dTMP kinase
MAYQGALGIDPQTIRALNEAFAPTPDAVFLLRISPALALERIRQKRGPTDDVFEREEYLKEVDDVFRTLQGPHIHSIAADQPIDVVTSALQEKIQEILGACSLNPPPPSPERA